MRTKQIKATFTETNYEIICKAHKKAMRKTKGRSLHLAEWVRSLVLGCVKGEK